ncbi:MAG: hypothetical protein DWQ36_06930 [Acidobacteria bacterium]|nr:MAG: hypothetical protein DWQ30_24365 [Acidobacteriota bacterium]REK09279.1 MAG: hypothetical protein DWQ36_06930 [Acidobacteriota bacterium]
MSDADDPGGLLGGGRGDAGPDGARSRELGADEIDTWRQADRLFEELIDLDREARRARLAQLAPKLRDRVAAMLSVEDVVTPLDNGAEGLLSRLAEETEDTSPDSGSLSGRVVGAFRLEEEIGRGGMSVVYRASRVDPTYQQEVAVKLLSAGQVAAGGGLRFSQEVRLLAQLSHPGIATLLDAGVADDGTPWLAMELVEGERIDTYCAERSLSARGIVELVLQVAEAVAFAHSRLIVHRDLKPGNVLVDERGRVRLLDFGIAKILEPGDDPEAAERTSTRLLTPEYGAPEQLRGEPITTATDVHGLGSLLYRLLAGRPPYGRDDAVRDRSPPTLDSGATSPGGVDRDLSLIVEVALREEPSRRYASVAELADDLRAWLDLRPVKAAPDRWAYRLRKLMVRRKGRTAAVAAIALALVLGIAGTVWQARRAAAEAERRASEARRANEVSRFLVGLFEFASPDVSGGRDLRVAEALELGSRRIDAELAELPSLRADLLTTIAGIYRGLGLYQDAEATLARIGDAPSDASAALRADLERARLGSLLGVPEVERLRALGARAEDPSLPLLLRAEVATFVGDQLRRVSQYDEADRVLQGALAMLAGEEGAEASVARADVQARRAAVAYEVSDHDGAEALYDEALATLEETLEGDHTMIASVLFARGVQLAELRRDEEAIETIRRSLDMYVRLLGEDHPDVAIGLVDLATVYSQGGDYQAAEEAQQRALSILVERLGERHPEVLELKNSIALLAYRRGDADQAIEQIYAVVEAMTEVLGERDPVRLEVAVNLGAMLRVVRRLDEALEVLTEALGHQLEVLGEQHASTAHSLSHIGSVHRDAGRPEEALRFYERAYDAVSQAIGEEHPEALSILANIGSLQYETGRHSEAVASYRQAHEGLVEAVGADDPLVAIVASRWARALTATGDAPGALEVASAASELSLRLLGDAHPRTWEAELARGEALLALGRVDDGRRELADLLRRVDQHEPEWRYRAEIVGWLE